MGVQFFALSATVLEFSKDLLEGQQQEISQSNRYDFFQHVILLPNSSLVTRVRPFRQMNLDFTFFGAQPISLSFSTMPMYS